MVEAAAHMTEISIKNPLEQIAISQQVLDYVGPGEYFFVSAVCSQWREAYSSVKSTQIYMDRIHERLVDMPLDFRETVRCCVTAKNTLYSAIFASSSRVTLARDIGLDLSLSKCQYIAGKVADIATLQCADSLGMPLSNSVLRGALWAGCVSKLRWLHEEQHCPLHSLSSLDTWAGMGGSTEVLAYLNQHAVALTSEAMTSAVLYDNLPAVQYLYNEGVPVNNDHCRTAATACYCDMLQ